MADIEQIRFFNSSITSINAVQGWGTQPSTIDIELVDDVRNGDSFSPVPIGFPAYFSYYGLEFGGILQKYVTVGAQSGNPTYKVILTDPREILSGVQIILEGYTGASNQISNLYNVYGYLENLSYGGSQSDELGMPANLIRTTLETLIQTTPIVYRTQPYIIDLSELPIMPDQYRVGGAVSMSVLDFVDRVCSDSARDYFFRLVLTSFGHTIKLYTISRASQPALNVISDFILQYPEVVSKEAGIELRNEPTSKFLVGGQVEQIFIQESNDDPEDDDEDDRENLLDDNIVQFWGFRDDGDVIVGLFNEDSPDDPYFFLNTRGVFVEGVEQFYMTDEREIRAVLGGRAAWEGFLWLYNDDNTTPHFKKAEKLGILGPLRRDVRAVIAGLDAAKFKALKPDDLLPVGAKEIEDAAGAVDEAARHEENIARLFEALEAYANEYYGRQFLVRIPFVFAKRDSITGQITTSQEPSQEGGYLEESLFDDAVGQGFMPIDVNFVTSEDNRLLCYVRFNDAEQLDLSKLDPDTYKLSPYQSNEEGDEGITKYFVFVRCEIYPKVVFLDRDTAFSPRVLITLPAPIYPKDSDGSIDFAGVLRPILRNRADELGLRDAETLTDKLFKRVGGEKLFFPYAGIAEKPNVAFIPLRSNILTYGPWYVDGAEGKVEFEQDVELVPWNFGSYSLMNEAANAKVSETLANQQLSETGALELPGAPSYNLGAALLGNGPYITSINVGIGQQGVTTSYRMETWTPRFGRVYKQNIERMQKISRELQQERRLVRNKFKVPSADIIFPKRLIKPITPPARIKSESSIGFMAGQLLTNETTGLSKINLAMLPGYHVPTQIGNDYDRKGLSSLDKIFIPFTTNPNASGLPKFENPTASGSSGRSNVELNPYQNNTLGITIRGTGLIDGQYLGEIPSGHANGIALQGPVIIGGWGWDTNGKPVPNSNPNNPTNNFAANYLQKPELWKVGPLDIAWDSRRKVWATGGSVLRIVELVTNLTPGSFCSGQLYTITGDPETSTSLGFIRESGLIRIWDVLTPSVLGYTVAPSGTIAYVQQEKTSQAWIITGVGVW